MASETIRITGIVQGVGFRPNVWRLARACGITGAVWNDTEGVTIHAWGDAGVLDEFVRRIQAEAPPLARIEAVVRAAVAGHGAAPRDFQIVASRAGEVKTGVAADAATCAACLAEVFDPADRRHRYPFANCTHCGPRLSIVRAIPYDRANTSMAPFPMCAACLAEYRDPADRRFHAQPNACAGCGPRVWLEDAAGQRVESAAGDDAVAQAARLIRDGAVVAVKGVGGFHLACDAGNAAAVAELRRRKVRYHKALALMARDLDMVRRFAAPAACEAKLLGDKAAPIVVLDAAGEPLAAGIAPGQRTLGFMLPYTPLHHLLLRDMTRPLVMTSGNRSDEPQTTDNRDAHRRLERIADYYLLHDRDIVNRVDDSVVRVADGRPRLLRRARGYAPEPLALSDGFAAAGNVLAMGGELKNTFCLLQGGRAVLSQHIGDLEDAVTYADYRRNLDLYKRLFDFRPQCIAIDRHPRYLSTRLGREWAAESGVPLVEVQHHHAHVAACLAEHGVPLDGPPVLGIVLDGLGFGADGALWGGEFLRADYAGFTRLARFLPVPMVGGAQAAREPWRNTWAHLHTAFGWQAVRERYATSNIVRFLETRPLDAFAAMVGKGINSPAASSAGRLFDAVAAALGVCRERVSHEGQAAIELEALAATEFRRETAHAYPVQWQDGEPGMLHWAPLWTALLNDLERGTAPDVIAARFHQGVAVAVVDTAQRLCARDGLDTAVLGGGVFQNRLLLEGVSERLRAAGIEVLAPERVPANDGGLALGQAAIAAAHPKKPGSEHSFR